MEIFQNIPRKFPKKWKNTKSVGKFPKISGNFPDFFKKKKIFKKI
jgi:hypothetical protein